MKKPKLQRLQGGNIRHLLNTSHVHKPTLTILLQLSHQLTGGLRVSPDNTSERTIQLGPNQTVNLQQTMH